MCGKTFKKIGKFITGGALLGQLAGGFGGGGGGSAQASLPSPNAGQAQADAARKAALNNDGKNDLDVTGGGQGGTLGDPRTRRRRLN